MFRGAARLSSLARALAARQVAASTPVAPLAHSASTLLRQPASHVHPHELGVFQILRGQSTVPASAAAISPEVKAEIEHATGLEQEELIGEAEGKPRFDLAPPTGPFGTLEAPALIESYFDERLVGCAGGVGEEEHDVVWFRLKKAENHTCSVCGQVFELKVVGPGGPPGGHH